MKSLPKDIEEAFREVLPFLGVEKGYKVSACVF